MDACRHVNDPNLTMIASRSWFFIFGTDKRDNQMLPLTSQHGHLPENLKTKMDYRFTDELDEEPKESNCFQQAVKRIDDIIKIRGLYSVSPLVRLGGPLEICYI